MLITKKKNRETDQSSSSKKIIQQGKVQGKNGLAETIKKVIQPKQDEISIGLKPQQHQVRYLKFHRLHRHLRWGESIVPELRLNGHWLERAGFNLEKYVSVTIMEDLLIIKPATESGNG